MPRVGRATQRVAPHPGPLPMSTWREGESSVYVHKLIRAQQRLAVPRPAERLDGLQADIDLLGLRRAGVEAAVEPVDLPAVIEPHLVIDDLRQALGLADDEGV